MPGMKGARPVSLARALAYVAYCLGVFGLVTIMVFTFAVFESFVYLISNGALEWGPLKQVAGPAGAVSPDRTAESTIRRVGADGRVAAADIEESAA